MGGLAGAVAVSILLLLFAGFMVGPVFGLLDPDVLFGGLLIPLVSLSVAIVLFEGGLSLKFSEVYQLKTRHRAGGGNGAVSRNLPGRLSFKERATYSYLTRKFAEGAAVKTTQLTPEFGYSDFLDEHGSSAIPLFLINSHHELTV